MPMNKPDWWTEREVALAMWVRRWSDALAKAHGAGPNTAFMLNEERIRKTGIGYLEWDRYRWITGPGHELLWSDTRPPGWWCPDIP
jgi:hypothetical protein